MHFIRRVVVGAMLTWFAFVHLPAAHGQTASRTLRTPVQGQLVDGTPLYSAPANSSEDVLLEMASRAAVIFVGRVTAVQKPTDESLRSGSAQAVVEVDFAVERSVRGTTAGSTYALREWAGLWRDNPRFLSGQRLLMLLHAPGPGGLSSPVDGLDGAIPVQSGGLSATLTLTAENSKLQAVPQADETTSDDQVDMRWLQAKTLKIPSYADAPTADPGVAVAGAGGEGPVTGVADPAVTSSGAQSVGSSDPASSNVTKDPLSRVLGLLGSVQALNQKLRSASH